MTQPVTYLYKTRENSARSIFFLIIVATIALWALPFLVSSPIICFFVISFSLIPMYGISVLFRDMLTVREIECLFNGRDNSIPFEIETFEIDQCASRAQMINNFDLNEIKLKVMLKDVEAPSPSNINDKILEIDASYLARNGNKVSLRFRPVFYRGKRYIIDPELVDVVNV